MHTKEQWELITGYSGLIFHEEQCIARCCEPQSYANARRIVACVNACSGIPTDELETTGLPLYMHRSLVSQRDELLAALKVVQSENSILSDDTVDLVDALIAKAGLHNEVS